MQETSRSRGQQRAWSGLSPFKYIQVVSFRRNGAGVATPVWFATQGERLLIATETPSGKVKRLRANPRMQVAACGPLGGLRGPLLEANARELSGGDAVSAERVLAARFGLGRRIFQWIVQPIFHRQGKTPVYFEILSARGEAFAIERKAS